MLTEREDVASRPPHGHPTFPIGTTSPIVTAEEFGRQIAQARRSLNLTQRDLALAIGTGERFIVELERGKPTAQLEKALRAAQAVGVIVSATIKPRPPGAP